MEYWCHSVVFGRGQEPQAASPPHPPHPRPSRLTNQSAQRGSCEAPGKLSLRESQGLWTMLARILPVVLHVYTDAGRAAGSRVPCLMQSCSDTHGRGEQTEKMSWLPQDNV